LPTNSTVNLKAALATAWRVSRKI